MEAIVRVEANVRDQPVVPLGEKMRPRAAKITVTVNMSDLPDRVPKTSAGASVRFNEQYSL